MAGLNEAAVKRLLEAIENCESTANENPENLKALIGCLSTMICVQNEELRLYEMTLALLRGREESSHIALNVLDQALKKMTTDKRAVHADEAIRHVHAFREELDVSRSHADTMKAVAVLALKLTRKLLESNSNHTSTSSEECAA